MLRLLYWNVRRCRRDVSHVPSRIFSKSSWGRNMHALPWRVFQRSGRNCQTDVQRVYAREIFFKVESVFVAIFAAAVVLQKLLVGVLQQSDWPAHLQTLSRWLVRRLGAAAIPRRVAAHLVQGMPSRTVQRSRKTKHMQGVRRRSFWCDARERDVR